MGKRGNTGKAEKGRGEVAGGERGERCRGEEKRTEEKRKKNLEVDTRFDLAVKGRYLNQSWLEYRKKTL